MNRSCRCHRLEGLSLTQVERRLEADNRGDRLMPAPALAYDIHIRSGAAEIMAR